MERIVSSKQRQIVLNVFLMRFGHHPAAWRHPSSTGTGRPDVSYWVNLAKLAEQAKFDTFFLADFIGRSGEHLEESSLDHCRAHAAYWPGGHGQYQLQRAL